MNLNSVYVINPLYKLERDQNKVIIYNRYSDPIYENFLGFVHPFYAIMLSFFDGQRKLKKVFEELTRLMKIEQEKIINFLKPLLENAESVFIEHEGRQFSFPQRILIKSSDDAGARVLKYNPRDFFIRKADIDFENWRLDTPLDLLFVVNTVCWTNCIYCYADRRVKTDCRIPLKRVKQIILEAKDLGMRAFDISGGELFLYKHWEEFLAALVDHGFSPFISTKCPVDEEIIAKLKNLGINKLQVSLDSINKEELKEILDVDDSYAERLIGTPRLLDKCGMEVYTNSQINSVNKDSVEKLLSFLLKLENIKRISIGAAGFSLYQGENAFASYKIPLDKVKKIDEKVKEIRETKGDKIDINFSGYMDNIFKKPLDEREKIFWERARCSGNFYSFVILPDGKVTICEELYWDHRFIIGDLSKQSIQDVWNSEKALHLYNLARSSPEIREDSACKNCDKFVRCRQQLGICWKEIVYAYGFENWDYPDPKCPKAPPPKRIFFIE